ncbi:MAG: hypothetical protein SWH61_06430 [Thermodesulfobacteriota bacterium]|nr:hypothetical protein [Thermodesulfobacteriota bacterium]
MDKDCKTLADNILALFRDGFHAGEEVLQYIDSVLGGASISDLQHLLTLEADGDGAPLVDLVVSPDTAMQERLEAILERHVFQAGDKEAILKFFPSAIHTSLYLSEEDIKIKFSVSSASAARFLDQLRIPRQIAPQVQAALVNRFSRRLDVRAARVLLRNARRPMADDQLPAFVRFVESYPATEQDKLMTAMRLFVSILNRQMANESLLETLGREKQQRLRQIRATERLERQMARKNMETLMLQGSRGMLMADKPVLFREIGMIDRIALAVCGQLPEADDVGGEEPAPWSAFSFEKPTSG